jgi:hypothetical protein
MADLPEHPPGRPVTRQTIGWLGDSFIAVA